MPKKRKIERYANERLYNIWYKMISRCLHEDNYAYPRYGARGIAVCEQWANDFRAFVDWALSNGYSQELTLDRINNDGHYSQSNCRWVDEQQQALNRHNNIIISIGETTMVLSEWAEMFCLDREIIKRRMDNGLSGVALIAPKAQEKVGERHITRVVTTDGFKFRVRIKKITIGQYNTIGEAISVRNKAVIAEEICRIAA